jgi:hypothetical protein
MIAPANGTLGTGPVLQTPEGTVTVATREQVVRHPGWPRAYARQRKDRRYYEIVEDTLLPRFEYGYFILHRDGDDPAADTFQPFFVLDQDLLSGSGPRLQGAVDRVRRTMMPRCMLARTIMVGCAAGEGHLDGHNHSDSPESEARLASSTRCLRVALDRYARQIGARLIVFKEFPATYRRAMRALTDDGAYTRVPSMPMTRLPIAFDSFEDYLSRVVSKATRKDLRRKFKVAAKAAPIELQTVNDVAPYVDEFYPLYLQVYHRSRMRFEQLTPQYLCRLGRQMPDKVRFFLWRQSGRPVAFATTMLNDGGFYDEYLGLDYSVALDLHLYFYTMRDLIEYAIKAGCSSYYSSALNYEPKLHLRCELMPLDLYVRHTMRPANAVMRHVLPLLGPTRGDPSLPKFPNFAELHG